eukprot:m.78825 g.78825  ORF g.78825 m.78825 type:complete len:825 (+) comp13259_c0_seq2:77-2551(+)
MLAFVLPRPAGRTTAAASSVDHVQAKWQELLAHLEHDNDLGTPEAQRAVAQSLIEHAVLEPALRLAALQPLYQLSLRSNAANEQIAKSLGFLDMLATMAVNSEGSEAGLTEAMVVLESGLLFGSDHTPEALGTSLPWLITLAQSDSTAKIPALGILALLCRRPGLQAALRNNVHLRKFLRALVNNLSQSDYQGIICSLAILASLALDTELGQRLFSAHNITQTVDLLFNILLADRVTPHKQTRLVCCSAHLFLDLFQHPHVRTAVADHPATTDRIAKMALRLRFSDRLMADALLHMLAAMAALPALAAPVAAAATANSSTLVQWALGGTPAARAASLLLQLPGLGAGMQLQHVAESIFACPCLSVETARWLTGLLAHGFDLQSPRAVDKLASLAVALFSVSDADSIAAAAALLAQLCASPDAAISPTNAMFDFVAKILRQGDAARVSAVLALLPPLLNSPARRTALERVLIATATSAPASPPQAPAVLSLPGHMLPAHLPHSHPGTLPLSAAVTDSCATCRGSSPLRGRPENSDEMHFLMDKIRRGLELKDLRSSEVMALYERRIAELERSYSDLMSTLNARTTALQQADRLLADYQRRHEDAATVETQLRLQLQAAEENVRRAGEDRAVYGQQESVLRDMQARLGLQEQRVRTGELQLKSLQTELADRAAHAETLSQRNASMTTELAALQAELSSVTEKYRQAMAATRDLQATIDMKSSQLRERDEAVTSMMAELGRARDGLSQRLQECEALGRDLASGQQRLAALEAALADSRSVSAHMQAEIQRRDELLAMVHELSGPRRSLVGAVGLGPSAPAPAGNVSV